MTSSLASDDKPNRVYLLLCTVVATVGGLLFGYDTAVIAGTVEYLQEYFELSDIALGWVASSALIGCAFGSVAAGQISDKLGRKPTMVLAGFLFLVSAVWSALPSHPTELAVARLIGGFGVGMASVLSPMYISEISPARYRGALVTLNQIAILAGMIVVYIVNAQIAAADQVWVLNTGWRYMFGSESIPALAFIIMLFFIPESPRWLMKAQRTDTAVALLKKLHGRTAAKIEQEEIEKNLQAEQGSWREVWGRTMRPVVFLGVGLAILQQITGINIVMYYAPRIFTAAGVETSTAVGHSVIIGLVMAVFTVAAMVMVEKLGRKPSMIISAAGMGIALAAMALAFGEVSDDGSGNATVLLLSVLAYVAAFSLGMGPTCWVILAEIFPNKIRGRAMSVAVFAMWMTNFLVSQFFPYLLSLLEGKVFWLYAAMCVVSVAYFARFLRETAGKSLEQIETEWHQAND